MARHREVILDESGKDKTKVLRDTGGGFLAIVDQTDNHRVIVHIAPRLRHQIALLAAPSDTPAKMLSEEAWDRVMDLLQDSLDKAEYAGQVMVVREIQNLIAMLRDQ